jgi:hypothetical protein
MGPMHPYDLILWLTVVGICLILSISTAYLYRKYQGAKEQRKKAEKATRIMKGRYDKIKGPGNPSMTIFEQQKEIGMLKARNAALRNGKLISAEELGALGFGEDKS